MSNIICLKIADLYCQLNIQDLYYRSLFLKEYFTVNNKRQYSLKINIKNSINDKFAFKMLSWREGDFYFPENYSFNGISFVLKAFIEHFMVSKNIFLLHASAFVNNEKALIFSGHRGAGKSTIIKAVAKDKVLGDDTVVLKKIGRKFFAFTSPFEKRKYPDLEQRKIPVKSLFFLRQAPDTKFVSLNLIDAFRLILYNNFLSQYYLVEKKLINLNDGCHQVDVNLIINKYYKLIFGFLTSVPTYQLYFSQDLSFLSKLK